MAKPRGQISLEQRVLSFMREQDLVPDRKRLLVAVSGGPDSVCMLHVLFKLQEELGIRLHVAHLNHGLRGAESEADAQYVAGLTHKLGIPATIEQRDVGEYHAQHHVSLEEAAREVRYTFLAEVALSVKAEQVAVGHTVNDHVETILMHLIRGSGTRGMQGLKPINLWQSSGNSLTIIRPLLQISREETTGYCRKHRLMPHIDTSNLSLPTLRNRIRHQLLPLLQSYNPQVAEALLRNARIVSNDLDYLDREIELLWDDIVRTRGNTLVLGKKEFLTLHPALKRHLLRAGIEKLLGNLMDIEARHIEDILDASTKSAGKRIDLPEGLTFTVEYDKYLLGFNPAELAPFPVLDTEIAVNIPGSTLLPGWQVKAAISDAKGDGFPDNGLTACFDLDKAGSELTVRRKKPGDRFQPLGMAQPKKVGEFMIDAKIPQSWRRRVPLVCSPAGILWVVGWRIDERVKVTARTQQVLRLEFERI